MLIIPLGILYRNLEIRDLLLWLFPGSIILQCLLLCVGWPAHTLTRFGRENCFDVWNKAEVTICQFQVYASRVSLALCQENMPWWRCWRMRQEGQRPNSRGSPAEASRRQPTFIQPCMCEWEGQNQQNLPADPKPMGASSCMLTEVLQLSAGKADLTLAVELLGKWTRRQVIA